MLRSEFMVDLFGWNLLDKGKILINELGPVPIGPERGPMPTLQGILRVFAANW